MNLDGPTYEALSYVSAWTPGPLGWERGALTVTAAHSDARLERKREAERLRALRLGKRPRRVFASEAERREAKRERDRRSHLATKKGRKRLH